MVIATTQPPAKVVGVGFGRRPLRLDSVGPVAAQRAGLLFWETSLLASVSILASAGLGLAPNPPRN